MNQVTRGEKLNFHAFSRKYWKYSILRWYRDSQVSKKRSSTMNSRCFGEYQATAFAEPRTCKAYSMANTGSSTHICQSLFFQSISTPESTLKLKGPAICNQCGKIQFHERGQECMKEEENEKQEDIFLLIFKKQLTSSMQVLTLTCQTVVHVQCFYRKHTTKRSSY